MAKQTFKFFGQLFQGKISKDDVGGPITIIKVTGKVAKAGLTTLMFFIAYLSVQLAIFNIIPFPALRWWMDIFIITSNNHPKRI